MSNVKKYVLTAVTLGLIAIFKPQYLNNMETIKKECIKS